MRKRIITIGRQFGSGGREIGKKTAQALGIPYYDKELLLVAAEKSGLSARFLESQDERPASSLLFSVVMGQPNLLMPGHTPLEVLAAQAQRAAVLSVAEKGDCVIVGRAADYILEGRPGLLKVFITADFNRRVERVSARDHLSPEEAAKTIRRMDKARRSYYDFHTDREWGEAANYDLCVNSSRIGVDNAVQLILSCVEER